MLPTTWNVPTVAIAAPMPAASEAPHSCRMPVRSRVPSSEKIVTTTMLATTIASPAWRKIPTRSPRRTAMIPVTPPMKM